MLKIEIWPYYKMVYAQTRIHPKEWNAWYSLEFWSTNRSPNPDQTKWLLTEKENLLYRDLCCPNRHRMKIKESKKINEYLDLAREQRKLWNIKVTTISIIIWDLEIITKGLERGPEKLETERRIETIQTTAKLRSTKILKTVTPMKDHQR